ncbi:MAG: serine hydrolase [Hyphomicrobiaceae bacterium]|nr:serine hydrolase [Hyphomicrobiaceae bacterium]
MIHSDSPIRLLRAALCLLLAALLAVPASAGAAAAGRRASMVIDANTGAVLHESKADEPRYPASLTKLMTLYLVFEEIERGRLTFETKIRMSERAASAPPSKLDLDAGEELTALEAVRALVTKSANDVAVAVAEHIGGSEPAFARMMTEKARLLGMPSTTFRNASGLPDREQVTTARDMLTLAMHLQDDFPKFYPFFSTRAFTFRGRTYRTHNSLIRTFKGMDGLKTGYIRMSGFNVVSSVRRGRRHVVAAVFGGTTAGSRNAEMRALLNRTIPKASTTKTRVPAAVAFYRASPPVRAERLPSTAPPPSSPGYAVTADSAAARTAWPEPKISIARVRPVSTVPPASPAQSPAPGLMPSTLQQQADNLARGMPPLAHAASLAGEAHQAHQARQSGLPVIKAAAAAVPSSIRRPAASGSHQIQVGAYATAAEAEKALAATLERATGLLAEAAPLTAPVQSGGRQLYRARFAGFDSQAALSACQELRRRQIDCFVAKVE